jgi:outer membrane protein assembly factor BamD
MIERSRAMAIRSAGLAIFTVVLAGWSPARGPTFHVAQNTQSSEKAADAAQLADREMKVGRYYIGKRNYTAAINRFKTVVTQYPASANVEEALAALADAYLAIGIKLEAQCAVALLQRKFPDGRWSHEALDALRSNGLEPAEDERSCISRAFN